MNYFRSWSPALMATAVLAVGLYLFSLQHPTQAVWEGWTPGVCAEYCENAHLCSESERDSIYQPWNAWSSLAYVFVGFLALTWTQGSWGGWMFCLSASGLGLGSFLFHASVTREGEFLDVLGMYAVLLALLAQACLALRWGRPLAHCIAWCISLGLVTAGWGVLPTWWLLGGLGLLLGMLLEALRHSKSAQRAWPWALPPLAMAFLCRQMGVLRMYCQPEHWLQPHTLWHLLTAWSLALTFQATLHQSSEKPAFLGTSAEEKTP